MASQLNELEKDSLLRPDSPCVGRCSTTYGDDICKGCGRTYLEVIHWITYDEAQKAAVWDRLFSQNKS